MYDSVVEELCGSMQCGGSMYDSVVEELGKRHIIVIRCALAGSLTHFSLNAVITN